MSTITDNDKLKRSIRYFEKELQKSEVKLVEAKSLYEEYEKILIQRQAAKKFEDVLDEQVKKKESLEKVKSSTSLGKTKSVEKIKKIGVVFNVPSEKNRIMVEKRIMEARNYAKMLEDTKKHKIPERLEFIKKLTKSE